MGFELVKVLYVAGATVYIMTRHEDCALAAIKVIESSTAAAATEATTTTSKIAMPGVLQYIHLDLTDLSSIPASAAASLALESRLDVRWNNAGVLLQQLKHKLRKGWSSILVSTASVPFCLLNCSFPC